MRVNKIDNFDKRQTTSASAKAALLEKFRSRPDPNDPEALERQRARAEAVAAREAREAERKAAKEAEIARLEAERKAAQAERIQAGGGGRERSEAGAADRKAAPDPREARSRSGGPPARVSDGAPGFDPGGALETPRLSLRRWTEQDAGALHSAFGDPDSMRFWDSAPARDVAETAERIRGSLAVSAEWHAAFAVTLRETQEIVGMVNYHDRRAAQRRLAVGWMIVPAWRGQGLAREAAAALLGYCFTTLGANRIEARIEPENAPFASCGGAAWLSARRPDARVARRRWHAARHAHAVAAARRLEGLIAGLERVKGIEPSYAAWEAAVLPLNYTRAGVLLPSSPNRCKPLGDHAAAQFGRQLTKPSCGPIRHAAGPFPALVICPAGLRRGETSALKRPASGPLSRTARCSTVGPSLCKGPDT